MINDLAQQAHTINIKNGFYDATKNIGEMIALIHSECSETLEADRKNQYTPLSTKGMYTLLKIENDSEFKNQFEEYVKDKFEDELADIMIRVMDLAAFKDIDIEAHIMAKLRYNSLREYKHGKKY